MSDDNKIVQLRQERPIDNVSASLRRLADEIEKGEHGKWPVTTCAVLLGHTDSPSNPDADGWQYSDYHFDTRGYGPRNDPFTVCGLMAVCLQKFTSEE
jgi:hypothetical protein